MFLVRSSNRNCLSVAKGADREVEFARANDIPVFYILDVFAVWAETYGLDLGKEEADQQTDNSGWMTVQGTTINYGKQMMTKTKNIPIDD